MEWYLKIILFIVFVCCVKFCLNKRWRFFESNAQTIPKETSVILEKKKLTSHTVRKYLQSKLLVKINRSSSLVRLASVKD